MGEIAKILSIKPYAHEHAARLEDPKKLSARTGFEKVGRTHGSGKGKVQGVSIPSTIDVIWYIYKNGDVIAQALRFPIEHWHSQEALKWLKDNKITYMSFEKATNGKSFDESRFTTDIYRYKSLISEIIDVDVKSGIATGYFSNFNNVDRDNEMIVPGAFSKTIMERGPQGKNKILHLLNHNTNYPLGKPTILKEDSKGLYFETKIVPTSFGKDVLLLYEAKVYNEHSIGYRVMKWEKVTKPGQPEITDYYKLLELYLYEGSTVAFGANEDTPFTGFKSAKKEDILKELNDRMNKLFKALKVGELTDETLALIETEYKQTQQQINDLISLKGNNQPSEDTEEVIEPGKLFDDGEKKINFEKLSNHLKI